MPHPLQIIMSLAKTFFKKWGKESGPGFVRCEAESSAVWVADRKRRRT